MVCGSCFFYCHYFKRIICTLYVSHVMIIYIVIHVYNRVCRSIKTVLMTRGSWNKLLTAQAYPSYVRVRYARKECGNR